MNHARQEYNACISENSSDQKKLFQITKSLLNMKKSTLDIPPHIDTETFVNDLGQWRTWHSASGGGGGASEGAKGPSPNERSERGGGGGGVGGGVSLSHGRELFYFDACDRTISCIPLVYFVDLKSLHNSEKIVLLKE